MYFLAYSLFTTLSVSSGLHLLLASSSLIVLFLRTKERISILAVWSSSASGKIFPADGDSSLFLRESAEDISRMPRSVLHFEHHFVPLATMADSFCSNVPHACITSFAFIMNELGDKSPTTLVKKSQFA